MKYTDGLVVENARIRNNLADGINFAQGTKNSTVKNSNIRGNGDDGLAIWSSISDGTNAAAEENNKFLNNTIESGWRAAGIGIFGGKGHEISGNLIKDVFAGAGIRVNTVFAGHNFDLKILELRFMTIPFYVQGQLMTSISSIVVPLISNKFVEQSRMSMSMIINY